MLNHKLLFPIRSIVHFVVMIPWLSFGIIIGLFHREAETSIIISWLRFFLKMYEIEVCVQNDNDSDEELAGCVFTVLSQNSLLDGPPCICSIPRPCRAVVNFEYALIPFFGWCMWIFCWVIVRQWPSQAKKTLTKVDAYLQNGGSILISIEGRRSKGGSISQFKKGPVVIAIRAQAKIVPVIIYGTHTILGYGKYRIRPGKVKVRFLEGIQTNEMTYEDRDALLNQPIAIAKSESSKNTRPLKNIKGHKMIESKVIIVGGGPAGSSCAWKLNQSNVECLVLEKEEFPRDKLCGGIVSPGVTKHLKIDIKDYPHSLLIFDSLDIHIFSNHINFKGTIYSIRRVEFDHWLLEHSGAQINYHIVKSIRKDGNHYVIDDQYRCKYLVGAGGTNCPVYRTFFKNSCPRHPLSLIVTMEQEIPYEWKDKRCQMWFFEKGFPGYYWYIPKADSYLTVGIGGLLEVLKANKDNIKRHWYIFFEKLKSFSLFKEYDLKPKGAIYYLKNEIETGRIENSFVIGDAAGIATRDLGEGIYPAVKSGILAAEAIVNNTDYSLKNFKKYSMGLEIGKLIEHCAGVNAAILKLKSAMQ